MSNSFVRQRRSCRVLSLVGEALPLDDAARTLP
jgi:hypothetical protein